jgi:ATPase family associated with various cellular activities (AAA)
VLLEDVPGTAKTIPARALARSIDGAVFARVPWVSAVDAHVLGTAVVHGRPAWRVSFFDQRSRAWFTVALDRRNLRTLDLHMIATAHFMHDVYSSFDSSAAIRPPQ